MPKVTSIFQAMITQNYAYYAVLRMLRNSSYSTQFYLCNAYITQILRIDYAVFTQWLRKHNADITHCLRIYNAIITQELRINYAMLRRHYACYACYTRYADLCMLRNLYASITQALRRHYAGISQSLRNLPLTSGNLDHWDKLGWVRISRISRIRLGPPHGTYPKYLS